MTPSTPPDAGDGPTPPPPVPWWRRPRPLLIAGGAGEVVLHAPRGAPMRVRIGAGAGSVTVDGTPRGGVAPAQVFTPPGWESAGDRYDVDAVAGVGTLTVDRR